MGMMVSGYMYCAARKRKNYLLLARKRYGVELDVSLCAQMKHCPKTNIMKAPKLFRPV